jgi:hypothetical protein
MIFRRGRLRPVGCLDGCRVITAAEFTCRDEGDLTRTAPVVLFECGFSYPVMTGLGLIQSNELS